MRQKELCELIIKAMGELAKKEPDFGYPSDDPEPKRPKPTNKLEARFQQILYEKLSDLRNDLYWKKECRHETDWLPNVNHVEYDICGFYDNKFDELACIIELKYVTRKERNCPNAKPSNPPAFPYDVLKDCLKIELGQQKSTKYVPGVSVGLTDWPNYWNKSNRNRRWSRNFSTAIAFDQQPFVVPRFIQTVTRNLNTAVYTNKRCHFSFSRTWKGKWYDYSGSAHTANDGFRYVLLWPDSADACGYAHVRDAPDTIPFLSEVARSKFNDKRREFQPAR